MLFVSLVVSYSRLTILAHEPAGPPAVGRAVALAAPPNLAFEDRGTRAAPAAASPGPPERRLAAVVGVGGGAPSSSPSLSTLALVLALSLALGLAFTFILDVNAGLRVSESSTGVSL